MRLIFTLLIASSLFAQLPKPGSGGGSGGGGGGTGCIPGGVATNILTDNGSGACNSISGAKIDSNGNETALSLATNGNAQGALSLTANAIAGAVVANSFGFMAGATQTNSLYLQPPNADPAANSVMLIGAPSSNVAAFTFQGTTGTGNIARATSPTFVTPVLGTPTSVTLTNGTGLPISTGVSGLGTGCATWLGTPSSVNLAACLTDETGSGSLVFATSPTLVTPALGTPASGVMTNVTGTASGLTAGITNALKSATTTVDISAATAPSVGQVLTATDSTHATWQTGGGGGVTSIATTSPITGGTITTTGTIACATCVTSAASLTSTAIMTGAGSQGSQTPSSTATLDSSGNISTPGGITTGSGGSVAGFNQFGQGTAHTPAANTIVLEAPTSVTAYRVDMPGAAATGLVHWANSSNVITETVSAVTSADATGNTSGSGNFCLVTSCTMVTPALGTPASGTLTNATGLPISTGVSGLGTGVATFLATPSGANLASALTTSLPNTKGGTGGDSSAATGVAQVSSGTWSYSTALANGTTATTQAQADNSTKPATTAYTDLAVANAVAGVDPAVAVLAASTASLTGTYSNGVSGVGATFTVTATGVFTLDGITINTIGQRVLLKDQSSGFQNGIYTATVVGAVAVSPIFTRALDYNTPSNINSTGAIPVQSGTVNTTTSWLLTSSVITVGTDALTYVQFSYAPSTLVQTTRTISTTAPLGGGGDLSANRTFTCTTCATTTNGGALSGTAPMAISAAGAISITGAAGQMLAGAGPAFTATPSLGTDNSVAGTLQLANSAANAHTIWSSGATTTNTVAGPATVPTTGHVLDCSTASTTCTLHDSGLVTANVVSASAPGAGIGHFAGSTQTLTSSAVVSADLNITTTTCTAPQVLTAISATAVGTCTAPIMTQNSQSAAYTTVLGDAGKQIYHPGADTTARVWTIDSNANVAYTIGTCITFINDTSAGTLTIQITSDTLVLAGTGGTGSRTMTASNVATACKMTSTRWMISGSSGLT